VPRAGHFAYIRAVSRPRSPAEGAGLFDFDILLQQILNGLVLGSVYALIALGYTMVYGILQLINFAHGDVLMASSFVGWGLMDGLGWSFWPAAAATIVLALCLVLSWIAARVGQAPASPPAHPGGAGAAASAGSEGGLSRRRGLV